MLNDAFSLVIVSDGIEKTMFYDSWKVIFFLQFTSLWSGDFGDHVCCEWSPVYFCDSEYEIRRLLWLISSKLAAEFSFGFYSFIV